MITKNVFLRCSPDRAFVLFTQEAGRWWPLDRRHTDDEASMIRMESTGRFFERGTDGTEIELGIVRTFEPPHRLVLDWYPGTDADHPTLVEITFASAKGGTRVTVVHDIGAAPADVFGRNAPRYDRSWDSVLHELANAA